jgi:hypothetical protein
MTGLPARKLGLGDRGFVKVGAKADLVVFDATGVADLATYEDPHRYAAGIAHVLVNGRLVVKAGRHTGALPERVLTRSWSRCGGRAAVSRASLPESFRRVSASQRAMLSESSPMKILLAWVAALAVAVWLLLWVGAHGQPGVEPAGSSVYTDVPEPELPAVPEIELEPIETAPVMTF